jgi:ribosomal subunit interface protein
MQLPIQITFRNMAASAAMETKIREKAAKLDQVYDRIMSCRVMVECSHRHHQQGNVYHVTVDVTVPDGELVASREPGQDHSYEDAYVAIRDAFNAARRQLQNYAARRQRNVKTHAVPPHGHIASLYPEMDYGKIVTDDGKEVYFHRNSVVDADFDKLSEGEEVRFVEEAGDSGPQASTVRVIGKHHLIE